MFSRWKAGGQANQQPSSAAATQAAIVRIPAPADFKRFGLENFGNTCYVNAIFQALYFCGPFRELVLTSPDPSHDAEIAAQPAPFQPPTPAPPRTPAAASPLVLSAKSTSKSGSKRPVGGTPVTPGGAAGSAPTKEEPQDTPGIPSNPPTLFSALRSLFWYISQNPDDKGSVSPLAFVNKVRKEHDVFRSAAHQDAHEFMNYLLNKIGEELEAASRERERQASANVAAGTASEDLSNSVSASSGSQSRNHAKTFVHALFEGVLTSETRCLTCETVSARDESFIDLSIDIEQNSSVTACLRSFSASEMLCQRNKFFCDACCGLQEAEKRMKIKKLPNVLALHLKRFKFQEDAQRYVKLAYRVAFPSELRLFNTVDEPEGGDPDRLYELFAIVVHIGAGPHHGHYIALVRARGQWLIYDDNNVDTVKDEQIAKYFGDGNGGAGYVLFYQAVDIDRESIGLPPKSAPPPSPLASTHNPPPTMSILNGHSQMPTLTDSPPQSVNGLPPAPSAEELLPPTARPQPKVIIPPSTPAVPSVITAEPTPTVGRAAGFFRPRRAASINKHIPHSPVGNGDAELPPPLPPKLDAVSTPLGDKSDKEKDGKSGVGWFGRKSIRDKNRKSRESASESVAQPRTPTGSSFPELDEAPPTPHLPSEFANANAAVAKAAGVRPPSAFLRRPSTDARKGSLDTTTQPGHAQSQSVSHASSHSTMNGAMSPHSFGTVGPASTFDSRSPVHAANERTPSLPGHSRSPVSALPYAMTPAYNASTTTTTTTASSSSSNAGAPLVPPTPLNDPASPRQRKNSGTRSKIQMLVDSVTPGHSSHAHALSDNEATTINGRKRVTSAVYTAPPTPLANGSAHPPPVRSHTVAPPGTSAPDFSFTAMPTAEDIGASPKPVAKSMGRKMSLTGGLRALNAFASGKDKDKDKPPPVWEATARNGY